jgi:hypothetical protein
MTSDVITILTWSAVRVLEGMYGWLLRILQPMVLILP